MSFLANLFDAGARTAARAVDAATSLGAGSMRAAAATAPGRLMLDALLDRLGGRAAMFDADERRAAFLALVTDSGAAAIRESFALAEAAARLMTGDARPLKRAIEAGVDDMRILSSTADMQELLPVPMVSDELRQRARQVVERTPERFLDALGPNGAGARPGEIAAAAFADAENLWVFLGDYPRVLMLIGTDVGKLVLAGEIGFNELAAFMEGRRRIA